MAARRGAQQAAMPMIGFLSSRSPGESAGVVAAFRQGLGASGFVEGQNVVIAFRWAEGHYDRLPVLAAELVGLRVAALFAAGGPPSALAAKAATRTIPIVFSAVDDPVGVGLVPSLSQPGGNITGMSFLNFEIIGKSAQLLKEMVPAAAAMAYLVNPANPNAQRDGKDMQTAAGVLRLQVNILNASIPSDIDLAFATIARRQLGGVLVANDPFLNRRQNQIAQLALTHKVPTVFPQREAVTLGGLIHPTIIFSIFSAVASYDRRAGHSWQQLPASAVWLLDHPEVLRWSEPPRPAPANTWDR